MLINPIIESRTNYYSSRQSLIRDFPRVGFEPTIPAFERAKTVRALDSGGTVIGN
jgi:hypothetical protein